MEAIAAAGYKPGKQIALALDPAASEFYDNGSYVIKKSDGARKTPSAMVSLYRDWAKKYPIVSLEDGMGEEDRVGWKALTKALGRKSNWLATIISSPTRRSSPRASGTELQMQF